MMEASEAVNRQQDVVTDEVTDVVTDEVFEQLQVNKIHKAPEEYFKHLQLLKASQYTVDNRLLHILSLHSNANLPWSSIDNSQIVDSIISDITITQELTENFIDNYKQNLKQIKSTLSSGLRPRLGHTINEQADTFQYSISLAQSWFLLKITKPSQSDQVSMLVTSFILNVLDTSDIPLNTQACQLLRFLISKFKIRNSGLIKVASKEIRKFLVYLPPSTSVNKSLAILSESYSCLFGIYSIYSENLDFIELLSSVTSSLARLLKGEIHSCVFMLLLTQADAIVGKLSTDVTISLSKLLNILGYIISNVDILERAPEVIVKALQCQSGIITIFKSTTDKFKQNLFSYKYDLLAGWTVAYKRMQKFNDNFNIQQCIKNNIILFDELASDTSEIDYNEWKLLSRMVIY